MILKLCYYILLYFTFCYPYRKEIKHSVNKPLFLSDYYDYENDDD